MKQKISIRICSIFLSLLQDKSGNKQEQECNLKLQQGCWCKEKIKTCLASQARTWLLLRNNKS